MLRLVKLESEVNNENGEMPLGISPFRFTTKKGMSHVEMSHWGVSKSITSFGGMRCMRETPYWVRCSKL